MRAENHRPGSIRCLEIIILRSKIITSRLLLNEPILTIRMSNGEFLEKNKNNKFTIKVSLICTIKKVMSFILHPIKLIFSQPKQLFNKIIAISSIRIKLLQKSNLTSRIIKWIKINNKFLTTEGTINSINIKMINKIMIRTTNTCCKMIVIL